MQMSTAKTRAAALPGTIFNHSAVFLNLLWEFKCWGQFLVNVKIPELYNKP